MAGDEVCVEMGFDDVLDAEVLLAGEVNVDVDVALGVDYGCNAFRGDEVGGVREAAEEELFDEHGFHGLSGMILLDFGAMGLFVASVLALLVLPVLVWFLLASGGGGSAGGVV